MRRVEDLRKKGGRQMTLFTVCILAGVIGLLVGIVIPVLFGGITRLSASVIAIVFCSTMAVGTVVGASTNDRHRAEMALQKEISDQHARELLIVQRDATATALHSYDDFVRKVSAEMAVVQDKVQTLHILADSASPQNIRRVEKHYEALQEQFRLTYNSFSARQVEILQILASIRESNASALFNERVDNLEHKVEGAMDALADLHEHIKTVNQVSKGRKKLRDDIEVIKHDRKQPVKDIPGSVPIAPIAVTSEEQRNPNSNPFSGFEEPERIGPNLYRLSPMRRLDALDEVTRDKVLADRERALVKAAELFGKEPRWCDADPTCVNSYELNIVLDSLRVNPDPSTPGRIKEQQIRLNPEIDIAEGSKSTQE